MVQLKVSSGRHEARADISEGIFILCDGHARGDARFIGFAQIGAPRRMNVVEGDHRDWGGDIELNVKTQTNQQSVASWLRKSGFRLNL